MKFGIANAIRNHPARAYPLADVYRDYIGDAVLAEQLGFSFSWYGEHRMTPCQWTPSPLTVCAWVAAKTTSLRVGPQVLCLPFHNPLRVAEDVAVIDIMSNGRFDFGIGLGWLKQEFDAVQVPWARRAQRTAEYVEVMKRLWTDQETSFEGEFYSLDKVWQYPKPVQQPHPPLYFGGESDAALKRAAKLGDGWFGYFHDILTAKERLSRLEELLAEQGRSRNDVRIIITPKGHRVSPEIIEQFAELGVDELVFAAGARHIEDAIGRLETMAEQLLPVAARV